MGKSKIPVQRLTIYRIKNDWVKSDAFIRISQAEDIHEVTIGEGIVASAYTKAPPPNPPKWAGFFEGQIPPDSLATISTSSALLVVTVDGITYAISFGQGRYLLEPDSFADRFGLIVTLNTLGEDSIKSIDKKRFDAILKQAREQANKEANPVDFGMDIEQDLLRAITGRPADERLGRRLTGMDALTAVVRVDLETLPNLLRRYSASYESDAYKKSFPWVDHFSEVKDGTMITELDDLALALITQGQHDHCWLSAPDIIDWDRVHGFRYGFGKRCPVEFDINLSGCLRTLPDHKPLSIEWLKTKSIYCVDEYDTPLAKWSAYKCLYAEVRHDDDTYLLSSGKWYRVTKDFVDNVNDACEAIPSCEYTFPAYDHESEGDYNQSFCNSASAEAVLMDKKTISHGGGYSKIEFCDILLRDKFIIHVKRYGGSGTLSHLFAQGVVSGELFQSDQKFREKVNHELPEGRKIPDITVPPAQLGYEVVFAIVSNSPGMRLTLPFFSKLGLKYAAQRLQAYGYRVSIAKIAVDDRRAKLSRYK